MRPGVIVGVLGAGMIGVKLASDAAAKAEAVGGASAGLDVLAGVGAYNPLQVLTSTVTGRRIRAALQNPNVRAAQEVIMWSEGTAGRPDPFAVCYGYRHTITDFSKHPKLLGWKGEPLDNLGPKYRGLVSTAAGAFQINYPTWVDASRALGLVDFSRDSQRAAAVWIMDQAGALDLIVVGSFAAAVPKLGKRWASFPGSTSGQGQRRMGDLVAMYTSSGGQA
jgi:muramidase (phage lysozyme)